MNSDKEIGIAQPKILALEKKNEFEYAGAAGGWIDTLGYPFCRGRVFDTLEEDKKQYDSTELVRSAKQKIPALVDQGTADNFLAEQLKTGLLQQACADNDFPMTIRMQEGYDHSYFFIASFIGEHIEFHARNL